MNIDYKDFIGHYYNLYPEGYCEHLIEQFEILQANGVGYNRQEDGTRRHIKDDHQILANLKNHPLVRFDDRDCADIFFNGLQRCWEHYTQKYSVLEENGAMRASVMKLQKTTKGGGYHVWHGEQGSGQAATRALTYMVYLNDIEEGGETEFLYQHLRVKPQKNLMLIWPAAFTHAHRGNPILSNENKYVVTGWFYYD